MKTCNIDGCNNPVWSKGVCNRHTPKTSLKKRTCSLKIAGPNTRPSQVDRNILFMSIWAKRPHVCQHCGKSLGSEPLSYHFDHILEKQKYKALEFEEENIWLVCLSCHDCKTRGIISEKYQEKINFVTTKFNVS